MCRTIYRYALCDAWEKTINQMEILDRKADNIVWTGYSKVKITVSEKGIAKIKDAMRKHKRILSFEELEFPMILDGDIEKFMYEIDGVRKEIMGCNLWAFKGEHPEKECGFRPVKALEVIELHDEIMDIIRENRCYYNKE